MSTRDITPDDVTVEKQAVPTESNCPYCGANPTEESAQKHTLSALGYLHDDINLTCSDESCGQEWVCGIPVGEYDGGDELFCSSCESRFMRIHRVQGVTHESPTVKLHMKCPNPDCHYYKQVVRDVGDDDVVLIGYPDITGSTEGADPYGWG